MIPLLSISELVTLYKSNYKPDRIKAGKMVGRMTHEQILDLKKSLDEQHVKISGRLAEALKNPEETAKRLKNGNQRKIFWGEDEWEFVTPRVSAICLKEPTTSLTNIITRIMEQMPKDKRRPVHAGLVSELSKRLSEYNQTKWLDIDRELQSAKHELTKRKEALSREDVILSLTEEEISGLTNKIIDNISPVDICSRFSEQTILDCISPEAVIAHAFIKICSQVGQHAQLLEENLMMQVRLLAELPHEKMRKQLQEKAAPARLPQVAFVGFKNDQIAIIADALRGRIRIDVIDKNRTTFDSQADIIILWTKFISHSFQTQVTQNMKKGARLIRFNGGLESAAREIERALTL